MQNKNCKAIRDANTGWGDAISDDSFHDRMGIPLGKITRRARRDGTPASDFAGLERMRRTSLPTAGVLHKPFWLCRIFLQLCNGPSEFIELARPEKFAYAFIQG